MNLFNNLVIDNTVAAKLAINVLNDFIAQHNLVGKYLLDECGKEFNTYMKNLCQLINSCETKELKIYIINNVNQLLVPKEMVALKKQFEEEIS